MNLHFKDIFCGKVVNKRLTFNSGIVSALKGIAVRPDLAMTGEITIMGKVLAVGGIQPKMLAAIDAGVKTVILPAENSSDVANLPDYMRNRLEIRYVNDIQQVLAEALAASNK